MRSHRCTFLFLLFDVLRVVYEKEGKKGSILVALHTHSYTETRLESLFKTLFKRLVLGRPGISSSSHRNIVLELVQPLWELVCLSPGSC